MGWEFIILFVSLVGTCILINMRELKEENYRWGKYILITILLIATLVRTVKLGSAMGLNSDEAMGGGNAWALAHYGVSYHLNSWPVYLIAWGSGMNILYPLITVPLIKVAGLSVITYRFPLVLLSVISYYCLTYVLIKTKNSFKFTVFFITILTLSPWTILSNRWAVESNLFPVLMIFALCCYLMWDYYNFKGIKANIYFIIFNFIIGISAYSYSCDWIFLAFFMVILYGWLLYTRKINLKHAIYAIIICLLIIWPLLLFIYVNYLGGHQMEIGNMTITKMSANRSSDAWVIANGNAIKQIFINIFRFIFYIILKNKYYTDYQGLDISACYPLMMLVAVGGLAYSIVRKKKNRSTLENYVLITLISSIPLILITWNNFVRDNVLIIPVFYFMTVGVLALFKNKRTQVIFAILFGLCFLNFSYEYFYVQEPILAENPKQGVAGNQTSIQLPRVLEKAQKLSNKESTIYINQKYTNSLYTAIRFYDPISPYKFYKDTNELKKINNNNTLKDGETYSFGQYVITSHINQKQLNDSNGIYIVRDDVPHIKYKDMASYKYGPYTIYVHKEEQNG